jgi:hypothetical protein
MPEIIFIERTVPGTDVVITVAQKTSLVDGKVYFCTTRNPGTSTFVNYLQAGSSTEAKAYEVYDFLWNDTVARRVAPGTTPECASCCGKLTRPAGSTLYDPWHCQDCGAAWDPATGMLARKTCLGCDATLELSDSGICVKCDEYGVIIVNGRAYEPVRN